MAHILGLERSGQDQRPADLLRASRKKKGRGIPGLVFAVGNARGTAVAGHSLMSTP
jgi:hypothetical protein